MFCETAHRIAFHNRMATRGKVILPLIMAARITRNGTRRDTATGKRARLEAERLMQDWIEEDRAANDGKGRTAADTYMAFRYRHGIGER